MVTDTVGGTTLGYCATGSVYSATAPISTMTIASTLASTGRSMKNFEIIGFGARRHDLPGGDAASAVIVVVCGATFSPGIAR